MGYRARPEGGWVLGGRAGVQGRARGRAQGGRGKIGGTERGKKTSKRGLGGRGAPPCWLERHCAAGNGVEEAPHVGRPPRRRHREAGVGRVPQGKEGGHLCQLSAVGLVVGCGTPAGDATGVAGGERLPRLRGLLPAAIRGTAARSSRQAAPRSWLAAAGACSRSHMHQQAQAGRRAACGSRGRQAQRYER